MHHGSGTELAVAWKVFGFTALLAIMMGCSSAPGDNPAINQFSTELSQLQTLAAEYDRIGFSQPAALPATGSVGYSGPLLLRFSDESDAITDSMIGELDVSVDFGDPDFGITGHADSFIDSQGVPLSGHLQISDGEVDRSGDPQVDSTVRFEGEGLLIDNVQNEIEITAFFEGDFYGSSQEALAGSVAGTATISGISQDVGGLFVAESSPEN